MFTGIVQGCCEVVRAQRSGGLIRLGVGLGPLASGLELGASVALNGACVTATRIEDGAEGGTENRPNGCAQNGPERCVVAFDLITETATLTNLGGAQAGDWLHVERSFKVGDEVGGHILSGHVACMVEVVEAQVAEGLRRLSVAVPPAWRRYLMPKGFVALDGVSLTIAHWERAEGIATVSLIPETLARTRFGRVKAGDSLNLEVDGRTQAVVDAVHDLLSDRAFARELLA